MGKVGRAGDSEGIPEATTMKCAMAARRAIAQALFKSVRDVRDDFVGVHRRARVAPTVADFSRKSSCNKAIKIILLITLIGLLI